MDSTNHHGNLAQSWIFLLSTTLCLCQSLWHVEYHCSQIHPGSNHRSTKNDRNMQFCLLIFLPVWYALLTFGHLFHPCQHLPSSGFLHEDMHLASAWIHYICNFHQVQFCPFLSFPLAPFFSPWFTGNCCPYHSYHGVLKDTFSQANDFQQAHKTIAAADHSQSSSQNSPTQESHISGTITNPPNQISSLLFPWILLCLHLIILPCAISVCLDQTSSSVTKHSI